MRSEPKEMRPRLVEGQVRSHSLKLSALARRANMSTTTTSSRTSYIEWLIESRPPSLTWSRSSPPPPNQPSLDLADHEPDAAEVAALDPRGVRVSRVKARWAVQQRPELPDAREWSITLALAIIQTLLGQRPVAHANFHEVDLATR
jgi:hypothetical protein